MTETCEITLRVTADPEQFRGGDGHPSTPLIERVRAELTAVLEELDAEVDVVAASPRTFRIVRSTEEQALRDAVLQLLANGADMGQISGLVLDALGCRDLLDASRAASTARAGAADEER